jgi:hypothetical protein
LQYGGSLKNARDVFAVACAEAITNYAKAHELHKVEELVAEITGMTPDARLVVALDWVEVRTFHTLMAAAVFGGRAVPLLWARASVILSANSSWPGLLTALLGRG